MMKRKTKMVLYSLLTFFAFTSIAFCQRPWPGGNTGGDENPGDGPGAEPYSIGTEGDYTYYCSYKYKVTVYDETDTKLYDANNREISDHNARTNINIPAGTAIGVHISETKRTSWEVTEVKVEKRKPSQSYCADNGTDISWESGCLDPCGDETSPPPGSLLSSIRVLKALVCPDRCKTYSKCTDFYASSCPTDKGCIVQETTPTAETITSGEYYKKCESDAEAAAEAAVKGESGATYQLILNNSNDIKNRTDTVTIDGVGGCNYVKPTNTCSYEYKPSVVCINVKTAAVHYRTGNSTNCNNEDEIVVKNDGEDSHWHYFIPLNTKTTDTFSLTLGSHGNAARKTKEQCLAFIDLYPTDYWEWMVKVADNGQFSGDIATDKATIEEQSPLNEGYGCKAATNITIGTNQEFYHETSRGTRIEGYELYYRPIDIGNPFPNGISTNSYWNDDIIAYDEENKIIKVTYKRSDGTVGTKTYDLKQSFRDISYYIYNINADAIRALKNDYNYGYYTSWQSMNRSGKSSFINNNNYVIRNGNQEVYKLGCGPVNGDWEGCS